MKAYFARPISNYDTNQDVRDIQLLTALGFEVINPNKQTLEEAYKKQGMDVFYEAMKDADVIAFRSFPDLKISAGVVGEISKAVEQGKLVIELPTITESRKLSVDETRQYLHYLGKR